MRQSKGVVGVGGTTPLGALLVAAECFFTSLFFHPPGEVWAAAGLAAALFQAPLVVYGARAVAAATAASDAARAAVVY